MYINSPGGSVSAGFGIYDTMQIIKPQVNTICTGFAASYGAILGRGQRQRLAAEQRDHDPSAAGWVQATDIAITAKRILKTREKLAQIISERTGQSVERVEKDMERDYFMSAEEAKEYGIIDDIVTKLTPIDIMAMIR